MSHMHRLTHSIGVAGAIGLMVTAAASAASPQTSSPPTIKGVPIVGKSLEAGKGLWRNAPTEFRYQWMRCDANGNKCSKVPGETDPMFTLDNNDLGHTILVLVTASNDDGSQTANSHPTEVVTKPIAPESKTAPTITGKAVVGGTLVVDVGVYSGGAVEKYAFQWKRCGATGAKCVDVPGATGQTYGVRASDVDHTLRVEVTARNEYGTTTSETKPTAVVTARSLPTVTSTMAASRTTTICCQSTRLTGHSSPAKAGEPITILARETDGTVSDVVTKTATDASGDWTAVVVPKIQTTYTVQTSTTKGQSITVGVHPRLGFGISGNNFSAKITGRDSFAGAVAYFQVLTNSGWRTRSVIVVNTFSVARFHVALKRGRTYTVRIYLPQRQAGPGYLDGVSHTRRVGGTA